MARRKKGTDPEKDQFLPQEGETYKDYMRRLSKNKDAAPYGVAGMIATSMLIKDGGANRPVEPDKLKALTEKISAQPAFNNLLKRNDVKLLVANGAGSELCMRLADEEKEYEKACAPYARSKDFDERKADFDFSVECQKKIGKIVAAGSVGKDEKEAQQNAERMNQSYAKTMWALSHTQQPSRKDMEHGFPSAEECRSLVWETCKRINGPDGVPGGGNLGEEEFELNMCLLGRYMPKKDFEDYCKELNKHRTREQGKLKPEDFDLARIQGRKERATEFNRRCGQRLEEHWKQNRQIDVDALAEAVAIRQLSHANGSSVLQGWEIEAQKKKLLAKGTAFQRAMQDIAKKPEQQEKIMGQLKEPGNIENLVVETRTQMRDHALRSAQYRVNRSVRALADGPSNSFLNTEHLADIIAAREFAAKFRVGTEPLSNGGFYERSLQIQSDPAFKRLAERYNTDPKYREEIKEALKKDKTAGGLEREYLKSQSELQEQREKHAAWEQKQREQQPKSPEEIKDPQAREVAQAYINAKQGKREPTLALPDQKLVEQEQAQLVL